MADSDKDKIKLLEEQNRLYLKQLSLQEQGYSLSTSYVESLKEVLGIRSRLSTADDNLLSLNKQINKEILNQKTSYDSIKDIQNQTKKNNDLIAKSKLLELGLSKSLSDEGKKILNQTSSELGQIKAKNKLIEEELSKGKQGLVVNENLIKNLEKQISSHEENLNTSIKELSPLEKQFFYTREQRKELEKQNKERIKESIYLENIKKKTGVIGAIVAGASKIPIIGNLPGLSGMLKEIENDIIKIEKETGKTVSKTEAFNMTLKKTGGLIKENLLDPSVLTSFAVGMIVKGFLSLDKAQTEFRSETGRTVDQINTINTSLITSADYIKQATMLTKQFGVAADLVFTPATLQEATEMVELMGMGADEAGRLAQLSRFSGKELKNVNENIVKTVNNFNKQNKTAISHKAVLKDVASVSSAIALSFKGNPEKIAAAASEARKLGINLEQADKIAESLLNFESSIENEMAAELLSGKQLNLEKARLAALNNDSVGLMKEIGKNQEVINAFSGNNRLAQESIAKSLGMSRDEMAKMILDQQLMNGLTTEQAAKAAGMTLEDAKRLSIQDSINKSIAKMSEALAGPLEMLAEIMQHAGVIKGLFVAIGAIIGAVIVGSLAKMAVGIAQGIIQLTTMLTLNTANAAAATTAAEAATLGAATVPILTGLGLVMGALAAAAAVTFIKDGEIDSKGGLVVSGPYGSTKLDSNDTFIGNKNGVKAGTDLFGNLDKGNKESIKSGGNVNVDMSGVVNELNAVKNILSQILAKEGTINIDGNKVGQALSLASYKTQ